MDTSIIRPRGVGNFAGNLLSAGLAIVFMERGRK
jgi:hypothetical protein